jgi:hypothetical protein
MPFARVSGERPRLRNDAVPTLFTFCKATSAAAAARNERYRTRQRNEQLTKQSATFCANPDCAVGNVRGTDTMSTTVEDISVGFTMNVSTTMHDEQTFENVNKYEETCNKSTDDAAVQCLMLTPRTARLSLHELADRPDMLQFYTSFENYEHFLFFFSVLGPAVYELQRFSCLPDPSDQLLLTLIKLRQAKEDIELSYLFDVSRITVGRIVNMWVNFMYFQLRELDLWPTGGVIEQHMPANFARLFPTTKLILDATEIPLEKPLNVEAQSATFSTYKNRNTLKTMVGCTPRGVIVYVSDAYGGSTSDRQIMERSPILTDYPFMSGDSIMADRGIMIQDLFASRNVKENTPHMLKGKHQLGAAELVQDRRIASKRIHVERVIGLSKTFKILKKEFKSYRLGLANRIIFVCFMLSNFRNSIVGKYA